MRKVISITFLLFLFASLNYGQAPTVKPILVGVFKPAYYEDIYEKLDNLLIKIGNEINPEKNYLAIRVCSNDPLPVAFVLAKGTPHYIIENLKRYNPSLELNKPKVSILRNNINCEIKRKEYFLTEYWIIPNNSQNLDSIESENSNNIFVSEIETDKDNFTQSTKKIINTLKTNKKSWLVINIPTKTKFVPKEIQRLQKSLTNNGIEKNRIFIKKLLTTYEKNTFKITLVESKI